MKTINEVCMYLILPFSLDAKEKAYLKYLHVCFDKQKRLLNMNNEN